MSIGASVDISPSGTRNSATYGCSSNR
jgi:hypothetical protein